jgi:formamidopyrimidine-DNA glycosylase
MPRLPAVPEVLEVELTRRAAAQLVGRRLVEVAVTDPLVVGPGVDAAVPGTTVTELDRRGKVLAIVTDGPAIGLHFGMTGRLLRDDAPVAIDRLAYGSRDDDERWDRWVVRLDDDSRLRLHDPRRLGRVWLDPNLAALGPDALTLTRGALAAALARRRAPVKAVLLDQLAVAGLGNLLVDEVLWWAGLDPRRPGDSLSPAEVTALQRAIRRRLPVMLRRGGSHTGTLSPPLRGGGMCPRDGAVLRRDVVAGRTTVSCPIHQR